MEHIQSSNLVTLGQNFFSLSDGSGYAACSLEYVLFQSPTKRSFCVWGAFLRIFPSLGCSPVSIALISFRIEIRELQNLSNSSWLSLSVGSIIKVLATGQLIVGA